MEGTYVRPRSDTGLMMLTMHDYDQEAYFRLKANRMNPMVRRHHGHPHPFAKLYHHSIKRKLT